jgi:hypothetical protein
MAQESEVTRGFGVLNLFFCEEAGKCDDISVDVLRSDGGAEVILRCCLENLGYEDFKV